MVQVRIFATASVSIHAPWEGCDDILLLLFCSIISFNSRTLGRVRLGKRIPYPIVRYSVSIHAPWEGCDEKRASSWAGDTSFNSRTLGRVRLGYINIRVPTAKFQFTHPGKGATLIITAFRQIINVSIHAPWEGCDIRNDLTTKVFIMFQFTHPGKGATCSSRVCSSLCCFNSRTLGRVRQAITYIIRSVVCFNSRTLGRVRRGGWRRRLHNLEFQFTHPGKGATGHSTRGDRCKTVSIHAPWEGCDG